ncbi:PQQ-binding-like beta-propeller repeat protein [Bremerella sp. JC770]|uniref:outer membrane protein assembly factor BamB family protein n=1 Tax=Bremerella sp. JC770 TaxID=3232137 RepID=UPI003458C576
MRSRPTLTSRSAGLVWVLPLLLLGATQASGQAQDIFARAEFSLTVELPETKNDTKNLLTQVDQQLQQKKWQDAIDTLERLISGHGNELIIQGSDQVDLGSEYVYYVELKTYLRRRISEYARQMPEFLEVYRTRIDSLAKQDLDAAIALRDPAQLAEAINDYFLSQHADEALLHLGDLLLEQGRFNEARTAWERISPRYRTPEDPEGVLLAMAGQPMWVAIDGVDWTAHRDYIQDLLNKNDVSSSLATTADSDVDPAAVWARLCLASWLEGSGDRAAVELELLQQLHPQAQGYLGGREVNYAQFLAKLLATSPGQHASQSAGRWPTYAGSYARTAEADLPKRARTYKPNWSVSLETQSLSRSTGRNGFGEDREDAQISLVAESSEALLSTYPVVLDGNVVVADEERVRAFRIDSGLPSFTSEGSEFYEREELDYGAFHSSGRRIDFDFNMRGRRRGSPLSAMSLKLIHALGPDRFTLASDGTKLVARIGTTAIGVPYVQSQFQDPADMVVFDMRKEGKLEARIPPVTELSGPWSFEGTAIIQGDRLYCGMIKSGVRDESAVACFDWTTSQMLWRRTICLTQPYGSGLVADGEYGFRSHNLLTLKDGVLYYNTNHGVIAALQADRGDMLWLTRYPRRGLIPDQLEMAHSLVQRNVNPCIVTRGLVITMPLDCERLLALDAATGQLVWQTVPGGLDPLHLLGATKEDVLVSGEQLFWVHLPSGKIRAEFPSANQMFRDRGYGRGALVGDQVYWPTRDKIFRLGAQLGEDAGVKEAALPIDLLQYGEEGGNIVVADGQMIVASPSRLTVYSPSPLLDPPDVSSTSDADQQR